MAADLDAARALSAQLRRPGDRALAAATAIDVLLRHIAWMEDHIRIVTEQRDAALLRLREQGHG